MRTAGAIDIGGTSTKIGIVAEDGSIVSRASVPTSLHGEPTTVIEAIGSALLPMLDASNADGAAVLGIGVSVAGFLNADRSAMVHNANLPALREFPLRRALEDRLSVECRLEVDSNAAVVAEYLYGVGRGASRLLGVTLGTGLGGGVIIDGSLLRFTGACAGDIGHIIVDRKGRLCTCGARGCLEAMVNSAALSERGGGRPVREIVVSARAGDEGARNALAETGWWLGFGLASLSPIFSPEKIVVGGGISAAGDLLLESARTSYRELARPEFRETSVIGSSLEGWDGMVGAASLFLNPVP
jgi:glucokinase